MATQYIELDFIHIKQPIGGFYIGRINWTDLIKIADADIRKIHEEDRKEDSFDSYLGIQRKIAPNRIKEIGDYVKTVDATFPTSIILQIDSVSRILEGKDVNEHDIDYLEKNLDKVEEINNVIIDDDKRKLKIRVSDKVARILDGQHRIEGLRYGFENVGADLIPTFELNVTIFVNLDIDDQAQVFSVINKAQTKVNKSLVYDLYEYAKSRSPQKTAHDVVRLLNKMADGPFYRKIKILGTAENKELETIAQATFVELIIAYISRQPMKDRDVLKRKGLFGKHKLEPLTDDVEKKKLIFRNLFINEKDEVILNILWNYFKVVQEKWPNSWNENTEGNILNKSTGLIALMKFLRPVVNSINKDEETIKQEEFKIIFDKITIQDQGFTKDIFVPGSSGQSKLLKDLKAQSGLE